MRTEVAVSRCLAFSFRLSRFIYSSFLLYQPCSTVPGYLLSTQNLCLLSSLAVNQKAPGQLVPHTQDKQTVDPKTPEVNPMGEVNDRVTCWVNSLSTPPPPLHYSIKSLAPTHGRLLRSSNRQPLAAVQSPNQQPVVCKRKRSAMPPVSKPTQRRGKEHQLENTLESEDELAVQSSRATSSRKAAPKDQPSLSASNPPTHNNAGDPEKQNPTAHRTSADTLDQLSDIHIHPNLPSTASPRKKSSRSPARAPSPSKESSLDESQYSKGSRTVTKKESLALMTPPVFFAPFSTINEPRGALPPMAQRLWTNYIRSACSSAAPYIPDTLKVSEETIHVQRCDANNLSIEPPRQSIRYTLGKTASDCAQCFPYASSASVRAIAWRTVWTIYLPPRRP